MLLKQTKIVATISDKRCEVDFIRQLFEAGMNVVRLNTAHLDAEGLDKIIANVRTVSNRIAILMDTKGPEVRTTVLDEPIDFHTGDSVRVIGDPGRKTTRQCIAVSYPGFVHDVCPGGHILIDDGDLELLVVGKEEDALLCEVQNEATLGSRKSVNVPAMPSSRKSTSLPTPSCATSKTSSTSANCSTPAAATYASSPRLRTRRESITSTRYSRWPTAS